MSRTKYFYFNLIDDIGIRGPPDWNWIGIYIFKFIKFINFFSWQELGVYDHPAVIDYITNISGKRLFYIGHSMAATTFSVMAIERPEVASKVKVMIGLAPATYVYHLRAPLRILVPYWRLLQVCIYLLLAR